MDRPPDNSDTNPDTPTTLPNGPVKLPEIEFSKKEDESSINETSEILGEFEKKFDTDTQRAVLWLGEMIEEDPKFDINTTSLNIPFNDKVKMTLAEKQTELRTFIDEIQNSLLEDTRLLPDRKIAGATTWFFLVDGPNAISNISDPTERKKAEVNLIKYNKVHDALKRKLDNKPNNRTNS